MDQRTKQMVRLKAGGNHRNFRGNSRWKDVRGSLSLEERRGEGLMEGRMRRKAAARRMLERRVSTRFSSEILLEQHFSALHSYFGSKSSGLIKMGRGLYTPRALEPPSTRPRRNIKMARLDWMKYVSVMMILADLYRFCSVTCQNFYLLLLLFLLLLFFQV